MTIKRAPLFDAVQLLFHFVNRLTRPVADLVDRNLGTGINRIVNGMPGFDRLEELAGQFEAWIEDRPALLENDSDEEWGAPVDDGAERDDGRASRCDPPGPDRNPPPWKSRRKP